jgi:predicted small lipoprotein YifL
MKRIIAFLMSLLLALSLCACNLTDPTDVPTNETTAPTESVIETTVPTTPVDSTDPSVNTTDPIEDTNITDPSDEPSDITFPTENYDSTALEEEFGITVSITPTETSFDVEVMWKPNDNFNQSAGHAFSVSATQNNIALNLIQSDDNIVETTTPDGISITTIRFALIDNSPVTVEVYCYTDPTGIWTETYDLSAVG